MRVEVNQGLLDSVYDLEREYRDRLNIEGEQRANFSCGICEGKASKMLFGGQRFLESFCGRQMVSKTSLDFLWFIW